MAEINRYNRIQDFEDSVNDDLLFENYFSINSQIENIRTVADFYSTALYSRSIQSNILWINNIAYNLDYKFQHNVLSSILEISFKYLASLFQSHFDIDFKISKNLLSNFFNLDFFNLSVQQIIDYYKLNDIDTNVEAVCSVKSAFYQIYNMLKSSTSISELLLKHSLSEREFMNDSKYRNERLREFILSGVDGLNVALKIADCISESRIKLHYQYLLTHFCSLNVTDYLRMYKDELFANPFDFESFLVSDLLPTINGIHLDLIEKWILLRLENLNFITILNVNASNIHCDGLPCNPIRKNSSPKTLNLILESSLDLIKKLKNANIAIDFKCFWSNEKVTFEKLNYPMICLKNAINQNNILVFSSLISKKVEELRKLISKDSLNVLDLIIF